MPRPRFCLPAPFARRRGRAAGRVFVFILLRPRPETLTNVDLLLTDHGMPVALTPADASAIEDVAIMLHGAGNQPANPSRCERLVKSSMEILLVGMKILLVALPVLFMIHQAVQTVGTPDVTEVEVLVKEIERREQQILNLKEGLVIEIERREQQTLNLKEGHVKEIEHLEQQTLNLKDESWADARSCADEMAMEKRKSLITQHQVSGIQVLQLFFIYTTDLSLSAL
jgi:hypothetical protein